MTDVKRNVVNGVNTIVMHGKNYVEVAERVRLVHEQQREFEVIESSPLTVGDRCLWRVVVKVDGKLYTGNAEVKLNARAGTPDATNPFECGETSALGRALAFAGFGSVESIASFDEVYRATASQTVEKSQPSSHPTTNDKETSRPSQSVIEASVEENANHCIITTSSSQRTRSRSGKPSRCMSWACRWRISAYPCLNSSGCAMR